MGSEGPVASASIPTFTCIKRTSFDLQGEDCPRDRANLLPGVLPGLQHDRLLPHLAAHPRRHTRHSQHPHLVQTEADLEEQVRTIPWRRTVTVRGAYFGKASERRLSNHFPGKDWDSVKRGTREPLSRSSSS